MKIRKSQQDVVQLHLEELHDRIAPSAASSLHNMTVALDVAPHVLVVHFKEDKDAVGLDSSAAGHAAKVKPAMQPRSRMSMFTLIGTRGTLKSPTAQTRKMSNSQPTWI